MNDKRPKERKIGIFLLYSSHCWALFRPGTTPRFADPSQTKEHSDLSSWDDDDLELLIEQGRSQLDRQRTQLRDVQTRSQFLLTTALGALLFAVNRLSETLSSESNVSFGWTSILLMISAMSLIFGALGFASNIGTMNILGAINVTLLSDIQPPRKLAVARAYVECVVPGENTLTTRFAIFWMAILLVLVGTLFLAIAWVFG